MDYESSLTAYTQNLHRKIVKLYCIPGANVNFPVVSQQDFTLAVARIRNAHQQERGCSCRPMSPGCFTFMCACGAMVQTHKTSWLDRNRICNNCANRELQRREIRQQREAIQAAQPQPEPRVGRAERDKAIIQLTEAFAAERLTLEEFEARVSKAAEAKVQRVLDSLVADVPPPVPPAEIIAHQALAARKPLLASWCWPWLLALIVITIIILVN